MTEERMDQITDALPLESGTPLPEVVMEAIGRLPYDHPHLAALVGAWADEEALPAIQLDPGVEESITARAKLVVARRVQRLGDIAEQPVRSEDLSRLIARSGCRMADVGSAIGLDAPLLGGLIAGRFDPDTVPARVSRLIANALELSADIVGAALRSPRPAAAATTGTAGTELEDFAEVVLASDLSLVEKRRILASAQEDRNTDP